MAMVEQSKAAFSPVDILSAQEGFAPSQTIPVIVLIMFLIA
jgi:hypothetical protein